MRKLVLLSSIFFLVLGCKKHGTGEGPGNGPDPDPDYTTTPVVPEMANTEIVGYVTNDQNQLLTGPNTVYIVKGTNYTPFTLMGNGAFNTGFINTDKMDTRLLVETGGGWNYINTFNTLAVSSSVKNYARIKVLNRISIGSVRNDAGGTYTFGGTGSITFGINSFYQTATLLYPGYFGPEINSNIYSTYHDPEHKEFALRLPRYLAGDDAQKRWFLKSYGAVSLLMLNNSTTNDNIDFYNGAKADLKLPIPASMQAGSPDSVAAWQLINGLWLNGGWAKKQGNFYVAKIGKVTAWNFAVPVKGVYLTVKLRTDSNATVTNTAIRIKSNNRVLAESRTDADGNAICFVPSNEALTAEVLPDERVYSNNSYSFPVLPLTAAGNITIKIPGTTPELGTIFGNAFDCNNQPVVSGLAKISTFDSREYFAPISNGKFASTIWMYGTNNPARVQITDYAGNTPGDVTPLVLFYGDGQRANFYSCQNSSQLYCNYRIDNTSYELKDNSTSPSVYMTASRPTQFAYPVIKTTNSNNKGVEFSAWPASQGIYSVLFNDIKVNGTAYTFDGTKDASISYTRFDGAQNGYIEGWFGFHCLDNANVSHYVTGNFKVKRTF